MTPQAKLEYIIYLVREYEADLSNQHRGATAQAQINRQVIMADCSEYIEPVSTIEPKADLYVERIEAWLESCKS